MLVGYLMSLHHVGGGGGGLVVRQVDAGQLLLQLMRRITAQLVVVQLHAELMVELKLSSDALEALAAAQKTAVVEHVFRRRVQRPVVTFTCIV